MQQPSNVPAWLLTAAAYRRLGWRDVFPLPAGQKFPPPTGYTGYDGAPVDDMALAAWSIQPEYGNLGLRLPDGILGIDVDAYGEKKGRHTIAALEREWGRLPDTWRSTARWPDDGDSGIRLFQVPPGLAWRNPGAGVESIHVGWRYAVVAPSLHPEGRRYMWVQEATGMVHGDLLPVRPDDLPMLPARWVDGLNEGAGKARAKGELTELPDEWATAGTCLRVTKQLALGMAGIGDPGGESRHDIAARATLALIGYGARGHGGVRDALQMLHARFIAAIEPVRGRGAYGEWDRLIEGAVRLVSAEDREPEQCHGPECEPGKVREVPDWLAELAAAPAVDPLPDAPVVADTPAGVDPDAWRQAVEQWVDEKLPVLDWNALWADDTEQEWIVEPLLPERRLVALYSAPKVGKSLLLLELAAGVACGKPHLLGTNQPPRARVVLYVDYENDPKGDIRERLQNMGYEPEQLANLRYLSFPTLAALDSEQGSQELMAAVVRHGAELVVIDTVSRAVGGDENENDTWLDFYRHTGLKLKQAGVSLIRLDHAGKDESKGQRGGSAKVGDVDAVWRMSRVTDETFTLDCEANRFPLAPEQKRLTLHRRETPDLHHHVDANGARAGWTAQLDEWERLMREAGALGMGEKAAYKRLVEFYNGASPVPRRGVAEVRRRLAALTPRPFEPEV